MPTVETSTDGLKPVQVTVMDDAIQTDAAVAPEGDVRFVVVDRSAQPHDLVIAESDEAITDLPMERGQVREDALKVVGRIQAGSGDAVVHLPRGRYVLFANTAGGDEWALRAELEVQPPEPYDPAQQPTAAA